MSASIVNDPWPPLALPDDLAARIAAIGPVLRACEDEAEQLRHLPESAVDALAGAGLFGVSAPVAAGGLELPPLVEFEMFESVARWSGAAGWNLFVGAVHTALMLAYLSDDAVAAMTVGPRAGVAAGQMQPVGDARLVPGGMVVSGRFSWGSGINHARWVLGGAVVRNEDGTSALPGYRVFVVSKDDVAVGDNWQVVGVAGSGSFDYTLDGVFVPDGWWFDYLAPDPQRGGNRYRSPIRAQIAPAHLGFALGVGERAFDEVAALALGKRRSLTATTVAERGGFARDLGQAHSALSAARHHGAELLRRLGDRQARGETVSDRLVAELRAAATYSTDVAVDVASMAMRYSGGTGVRLDQPIQRCLRELWVARSHMYVSDANYDALATLLLADTEPAPPPAVGFAVPDPAAVGATITGSAAPPTTR